VSLFQMAVTRRAILRWSRTSCSAWRINSKNSACCQAVPLRGAVPPVFPTDRTSNGRVIDTSPAWYTASGRTARPLSA
jgi:hypothetical protein